MSFKREMKITILNSESDVDKSKWMDGEWKSEPDKIEWRDEKSNFPCLIVRGPHGALCGYVGIDNTHPYFEKEYDHSDIENDHNIKVHFGLTYSRLCNDNGKICHIPLSGESDNIWWFGFDCAHCTDFCPKWTEDLMSFPPNNSEIYKNIDFVINEVTKLASQLNKKQR